MDNNDPWLDRYMGYRLESRLFTKTSPLVRRDFDVRRARPVWENGHAEISSRGGPQFEDDIDVAADAGKITEYEWVRIRTTDLVMRALRNSDDATVWFAVEASGAIKKDDIDGARQSAVAITKMYEQEAIPLVCGYRISDPLREHAREQGVHVFINPDNDYPA